MLKAMGIAGSPRADGNSTALLRAALAGAEHAGATTDVAILNDLTYRGCQACRPCTPDATCRIPDGLTDVFAALRAADVWVLAAPIYFDGVSGQMKAFYDRLYHLVNDRGELAKQLAGPRAGGIIVTYEDKERDDYRDVAGRLANYLGWMGDFDPVEVLSIGGLGPAGAAAGRADLLARAEALGRSLVQRLARRRASDGPGRSDA